MNYLQKTVYWLAQKANVFNTVTISEFYERNGYLAPFFGAHSTDSGISVSPETALEASAIYAGVKIIGEDMGSLPLFVYQRSRDGVRVEKARDHWSFERFHGLANPTMSSGEFVECLTARAVLLGDGFAWVERIDDQGDAFLWPWANRDVRIQQLPGRETRYELRNLPGALQNEWRVVASDEIFHLRGFTLSGSEGDDLVRRARQLIGITLSSQRFAGSFLKNDVSTSLFFEHPGNPGPEGVQKIKAAYKSKQGSGNAGEPFVLREAMKAKRLDPDMEKMQLIEVRKFQILEVCRILRMPPHKLADLERATFCLPASEEVFTEQGPKSIAEVLPGEQVWSFADGRMVKARVRHSVCSGEDEILKIKTTNRTIRCNAAHRILIRKKLSREEYVPAGKLLIGDTIVTFDSEGIGNAEIVSIEMEPAEKVYDLEVEGTHSFVASGVIVHNSNIEEQAIEYIQMTLNPWRRRWREAHYRHLLTPRERFESRLFAEHSIEALQRGSFKQQSDGFAQMLERGVYSINDVRRFLNLNPIEGGDEHRVQLNMQAVGEAAAAVATEN